jgi:hypothetical protein
MFSTHVVLLVLSRACCLLDQHCNSWIATIAAAVTAAVEWLPAAASHAVQLLFTQLIWLLLCAAAQHQ